MLGLEAELQARAERRGFGLAIARLFEVIDSRTPGERLCEVARRVREGRMKGMPELGATRDYLDARDAARALRALATIVVSPTVNVCSGRPVSGHELVRELKVSRMTANRAIRELVHSGVLSRVAGLGTFVEIEVLMERAGRCSARLMRELRDSLQLPAASMPGSYRDLPRQPCPSTRAF